MNVKRIVVQAEDALDALEKAMKSLGVTQQDYIQEKTLSWMGKNQWEVTLKWVES